MNGFGWHGGSFGLGGLGLAEQMFGGDMGCQSLVSKSFQPMDFKTTALDMLQQPLLPWGILLAILIGVALSQIGKVVQDDPIDRAKKLLRHENWRRDIAALAVFFGAILFLILFSGLIKLIFDFVWGIDAPTVTSDVQTNSDAFRLFVTQIAALTAVLSALIALPFTALRLKLSDEQNRHNQDVLYNDKLHNALDDLHARRQISDRLCEDDIIRRNGAIDRLQTLAVERPKEAPRIARMLCVYLKELSKEYPPEQTPENVDEITDWAANVSVKRSDMENAAQVLGQMSKSTGLRPIDLAVDLSNVNLQGMNLAALNFSHTKFNNSSLDAVNLEGANLESADCRNSSCFGSNFCEANLMRALFQSANCTAAQFSQAKIEYTQFQSTILRSAKLNWTIMHWTQFDRETDLTNMNAFGAGLKYMDFSQLDFPEECLLHTFGDATVSLPDRIMRPTGWTSQNLTNDQFLSEFRGFQIGISNSS